MRITPGKDPLNLMVCTRNRDHTLNAETWTLALRRNRGDHASTREDLTRTEQEGCLTSTA